MVVQPAGIPNEPSSPQWFNRFTARLNDYFAARIPTSPVVPFKCLSTAAPDPSLTPFAVALFTDVPSLVISTGTKWVRADGSNI